MYVTKPSSRVGINSSSLPRVENYVNSAMTDRPTIRTSTHRSRPALAPIVMTRTSRIMQANSSKLSPIFAFPVTIVS